MRFKSISSGLLSRQNREKMSVQQSLPVLDCTSSWCESVIKIPANAQKVSSSMDAYCLIVPSSKYTLLNMDDSMAAPQYRLGKGATKLVNPLLVASAFSSSPKIGNTCSSSAVFTHSKSDSMTSREDALFLHRIISIASRADFRVAESGCNASKVVALRSTFFLSRILSIVNINSNDFA